MTAVSPFAHSKLDCFRSGHLIRCCGHHAGSEGPAKHPHTSTPPPPFFMGEPSIHLFRIVTAGEAKELKLEM